MKNKFLNTALISIFFSVGSLVSVANATIITINNAGFETANTFDAGGGTYNHSVVGWDLDSGGFGTMLTSGFPVASTNGGVNNAWSNGGTISQSLTDILAIGSYDLSVLFGDRTDTPFPTASIELWAGATLIGLISQASVPDGTWVNGTSNIVIGGGHAALGETLEIKLISGGVQNLFDDVSLNYTAVPEPSTLAIFALGLMGLASRRFKKQS
jgi:hypothetical protein